MTQSGLPGNHARKTQAGLKILKRSTCWLSG